MSTIDRTARTGIARMSAQQPARAYRARELLPTEVTRATLERIGRLNPPIKAFLLKT